MLFRPVSIEHFIFRGELIKATLAWLERYPTGATKRGLLRKGVARPESLQQVEKASACKRPQADFVSRMVCNCAVASFTGISRRVLIVAD